MQSPDRTFYALLMAITGVVSVAAGDLITKNITNLVSLWQMLWLRSTIALLILLPILTISHQLVQIQALSRRHLITRSSLMAMSYLMFFSGLAVMPMAVVAGGFFSAPFFTVFLAWYMLREHVGIWRIGSVIVGFIGVCLILRPDSADADATLLLPVTGAFFYALTQVYTRKYCKSENSLAISFWSALCFMVIGFVGVAALGFAPELQGDQFYNSAYQPPSLFIWFIFIVIAAFSILTHFALAAAYQNAPASIVGPLEYLYLPIAIAGGYVFFAEEPAPSAVFGIVLILVVGVVIAWREHTMRVHSTSPED